MRTYSKTRDFKNRLKFGVLLIVIGSIAIWLTSCDGEKDEKSSTPPFTEFWFSSKIEIETATSSDITFLDYYNVWGDMDSNNNHKDRYMYKFTEVTSETKELPSGATLTLNNSQGSVSFSATGTLPRQGTIVPPGYTGDPGLWDAQSCSYEISVSANKSSQEITSAKLRVYSSSFDAVYDITANMGIEITEDRISFHTTETTISSSLPYGRIVLTVDVKN